MNPKEIPAEEEASASNIIRGFTDVIRALDGLSEEEQKRVLKAVLIVKGVRL